MIAYIEYLKGRGFYITLTPNQLVAEYYHKLTSYSTQDLGRGIEWLKTNYDESKKIFPSAEIFKQAIFKSKPPENKQSYTKPVKGKDGVFDAEKVDNWFGKILPEMEKEINGTEGTHFFNKTPGYINYNASRIEDRKPFFKFLAEKRKNHEIYNSITKKWQKYDEPRTLPAESYFDPRDFYTVKEYV